MTMNVGLNLVEVDGKATPALQGAATSVAGFVVRSGRGLGGTVTQVTSYTEFVKTFGSYISGAVSAYAIRGFFDNGGSLAYVTRVVGGKCGGDDARGVERRVRLGQHGDDADRGLGRKRRPRRMGKWSRLRDRLRARSRPGGPRAPLHAHHSPGEGGRRDVDEASGRRTAAQSPLNSTIRIRDRAT